MLKLIRSAELQYMNFQLLAFKIGYISSHNKNNNIIKFIAVVTHRNTHHVYIILYLSIISDERYIPEVKMKIISAKKRMFTCMVCSFRGHSSLSEIQ